MAPLSSRQINCRRTDADGRRRDLIRQAEAAAGRELGGRRTLPLSPSSDALPSENYNEVKVGGERRRSQVIRYANEAPVSRDVRIADLKRLATGRGGGPFRDLIRNHECPPRLWTWLILNWNTPRLKTPSHFKFVDWEGRALLSALTT